MGKEAKYVVRLSEEERTAYQQLIRTFGWTPSTVKAGMKLTMIGRQLKGKAPYLNLTERANIVVTDTHKEIYRTENFGKPAPPKSDKGSLVAQ